jgi:hypothetical protein
MAYHAQGRIIIRPYFGSEPDCDFGEYPIAVKLRLKALQSIAQGNALCSRSPSHTHALKGRNQPPNGISPRWGLGLCGGYLFRRALPYAIDNKAFSLNLTAMGSSPQ